MRTIQEAVIEMTQTHTQLEIGDMLGVSHAMISRYKTDFLPSIKVAIKWYKLKNEVLHPYSEEGLIKEMHRYE